MTTLTGRQVLALLAQDEVPEIEYQLRDGRWLPTDAINWCISTLIEAQCPFRIKPTPQRRLSVTLESGEVVSWPEPVREALKIGQEYFYVGTEGAVLISHWDGDSFDHDRLAECIVHLTSEAAQEHADALKKINTQGVV